MSAELIDGKQIARALEQKLAEQVTARVKNKRSRPTLAVIQVGDNAASDLYVKNKLKSCTRVGIESKSYQMPEETTESELIGRIKAINSDPKIHGILVQLPLPAHIDANHIIDAIHPDKDVDGFHPFNLGRLALRRPVLRPCTPYGVTKLLEEIGYDPKKGESVIVGASNIVGRPMMLELLSIGATVTMCHRFTNDLPAAVNRADLLIVAIGKAGIIQADWIKPGAVVIDVGINRDANGKLCGDVPVEAYAIASKITPVPGGVGPMTVACLMENTIRAAEHQDGAKKG